MTIRIIESARRDLLDGARFYERQGQGLGTRFLQALFADISGLRVHAGVHSLHFGRYHRMLAKRFPFAVYYRIEDGVILVCAVLDCRRDPALIRERLAT